LDIFSALRVLEWKPAPRRGAPERALQCRGILPACEERERKKNREGDEAHGKKREETENEEKKRHKSQSRGSGHPLEE